MEEEKRKLLRKGGTMSDWHQALSVGLQGGDIMWTDAKVYPGDVLEHARSMMIKGGYVEYECYDDRGRSQGRAIIELVEWEDMARGLFLAVHLVASDEYYEYYARNSLNDGKGVYHVCGSERRSCAIRLGRQDRRELVHLEKWRLMSPVLMMESPYSKELGLRLVRKWVEDFTPVVAVPEPALPPAPRLPGGAGGGGQTGLDKAAAEALKELTRDDRPSEEVEEKVKGQRKEGIPKGSVGALLQRRAAEARDFQREKDKERKNRRTRRRSRSRGRRRDRARSPSKGKSRSEGSGTSETSQGFQKPSSRGEEELWRLSQKHPGKLLKDTMRELTRYLAERSTEGPEEEDWASRRVMAYINQVVLVQHPPAVIGIRNYRELITIGTGVDLLLQGRLPELGDLLSQRLKALETSFTEQGWHTAKHQELIPPMAASLTSEAERRRAAKLELSASKLKEMVQKNKSPK